MSWVAVRLRSDAPRRRIKGTSKLTNSVAHMLAALTEYAHRSSTSTPSTFSGNSSKGFLMPSPRKYVRGAALLVMIAILGLGALIFIVGRLNIGIGNQRTAATLASLAQAKEALISYAVAHPIAVRNDLTPCGAIDCARPGELPCPDVDNDGSADPPCSTASTRLGRLPLKQLGLAELHDDTGEALWYAVSRNFVNNPRINAPLNSSTPSGTLSIRDSLGNLLYDASAGNGVIAVIIAPGAPLTRQDGITQSRVASNANNAIHYLDVGNGEDNAIFADSSTDGFILGPVPGANGSTPVNDRIAFVTHDELFRAVSRRVLGEIRGGTIPGPSGLLGYFSANGRFPWAALPGQTTEDSGNTNGAVPISNLPTTDPNPWAWFLNNQWNQQVSYSVINSQQSVTLTLNGQSITCSSIAVATPTCM